MGVEFCFLLGKTPAETLLMLKTAYVDTQRSVFEVGFDTDCSPLLIAILDLKRDINF